jgi:hypothetical protein
MRLDVTLIKYRLDLVFVKIVTDLKIYQIYKTIFLTIKVVDQEHRNIVHFFGKIGQK